MFAGVKKPEEYIEVSLEVPVEIHDAVCNSIRENFADGLVLEQKDNSDCIAIMFYLSKPGMPDFKEKLSAYINEITTGSSFSAKEIRTRNIKHMEWEEAYKASVGPTVIGNVITRPPWMNSSEDDKLELIIELYGRINAAVKLGGIILLSGLLNQDQEPITGMLTKYDILKYNINQDGQWLAITVLKK